MSSLFDKKRRKKSRKATNFPTRTILGAYKKAEKTRGKRTNQKTMLTGNRGSKTFSFNLLTIYYDVGGLEVGLGDFSDELTLGS